MTTAPKEYHVVEETSKRRFEEEVSKLMGYGYQPHGQMIAETESNNGFFSPFFPKTTYRQAMIK